MNLISGIIKDLMTGIDGVTYDPARVYGAGAVLVFFVLAVMSVVNGQPFDALSYGAGFGALLAGFGLGVNLKSKTEPEQGESK